MGRRKTKRGWKRGGEVWSMTMKLRLTERSEQAEEEGPNDKQLDSLKGGVGNVARPLWWSSSEV